MVLDEASEGLSVGGHEVLLVGEGQQVRLGLSQLVLRVNEPHNKCGQRHEHRQETTFDTSPHTASAVRLHVDQHPNNMHQVSGNKKKHLTRTNELHRPCAFARETKTEHLSQAFETGHIPLTRLSVPITLRRHKSRQNSNVAFDLYDHGI